MNSPYASSPLDAFMAAEGAAGLVLASVALFRPARAWPARLVFLAAVLLVTVAPQATEFAKGLGMTLTPDAYLHVLAVAAALGTLSTLLSGSAWRALVAVVGQYGLWRATHFFTDQDLELAALHMAWLGALLGFERLAQQPAPLEPAPYPSERSYLRSDLTLAATATLLASIVCWVVLSRSCDSADEWAYTFQAAVFAKLHAYSVQPPCGDAFQSFWVFAWKGRLFSQYLPGWPLFMAPFVALHLTWLAGPVSLGVLVAGVARLTRRAASATIDIRDAGAERHVRVAGTIAAVAVILSDTLLINGASRFPHVWICALFTWSVESLCMITSPLAPARRARWGVVLGSALAWLLATRHVDGCLLGAGMFMYAVYALARGRMTSRAVVGTAVAFALWGGLTLIILRLQLGTWFATGYSIADTIHTWSKAKLSLPKPNEWRWGVPLATGAYCWWPLAPSAGIAGLLALARTRERRVTFMLGAGVIASLIFYSLLEFGRVVDFGYGPRYCLVVIVPMAVGTGVLLAPLFRAALARSGKGAPLLFEGGPAALAAAAAVVGALRIAPLVYPGNYEDVRSRNVVFEAIKKNHVENAVVWLEHGTTAPSDWLDLTQNMPADLYPDSVYVLLDRSAETKTCVREHWPERRWFHTQAGGTVVPE